MNNLQRIIGSIARTLLGLTFIFSGVVKAIDPLGTTYKIEDYLKVFGGFFTDFLPAAQWAALALITIEFTLGVCLLLNVKTRLTSTLSLAFYLVMLPLTLYIAISNPVSDCGCFGDALVLTNWQTFWKNVILMALVIILLWARKSIYPLWKNGIEWAWIGISVVSIIVFMVWTLLHLPVKDFRPYKIGNNIPQLMEYPEDAEPDQYEISFVYEKEGVEQEFTLDNYPKGDDTWTFVRQNSRLIKKGYEPPIHDFEIISPEYEDITFDILESEQPVTLVVMYDLLKSDLTQMSKLLQLQSNTEANGQAFYVLTGSGSDDIRQFCQDHHAESLLPVMCACDPVTLKTIVRANPGVIQIQNGIVINKYNLRNQ